MGERDSRREAYENLTGRLVRSGMPEQRAKETARTAIERLDRRDEGRKDHRVPYPDRPQRKD